MNITLSVSLLLLFTSGVDAQRIPADSPKATISQRVGLDDVTIAFHRPNVRGRRIWGALVPYGVVWRTGADYPTFVTFSDATAVEGKGCPLGHMRFTQFRGKGRFSFTPGFSPVMKAPPNSHPSLT